MKGTRICPLLKNVNLQSLSSFTQCFSVENNVYHGGWKLIFVNHLPEKMKDGTTQLFQNIFILFYNVSWKIIKLAKRENYSLMRNYSFNNKIFSFEK